MVDGGKVLVVAGEASGEVYAARLIAALKKLRPGVEVYGVGGSTLRDAGVRLIVDIKDLSTFGIFEVFRLLPKLIGIFFKVLGSIGREKPCLVILIDYPDFNLRLARFIRWRYGRTVKILYYISPQVWIWRKWRAKKLAKLSDRLAVVFPFEEPLFRKLGVQADFVGHPLLETIPGSLDREELVKHFGLDPSRRTIALLPGSRHGEINSYLPVVIEAVRDLEKDGQYQFLLARAPTISDQDIASHLSCAGVNIRQIEGETQKVLRVADLAIVALGTATLESALMGTPAILIGWVQPLTYWVGVKFMNMDLPYYSLVNFILGRRAYPELIQREMTPENIARSVRELMDNPKAMDVLRSAAVEIQTLLYAGEGAAEKASPSAGRGNVENDYKLSASARVAIIADEMIGS